MCPRHDMLAVFQHGLPTHRQHMLYDRDINKVDDTMDDIREQMDLANEISDAISQPIGFGIDLDEVRSLRWG